MSAVAPVAADDPTWAGEGRPQRVWVVGAGLMGTSAALALRQAGVEVWLSDQQPAAQALGGALSGAVEGQPPNVGAVQLCLIAVPPAEVAAVALAVHRLNPAMTLSDMSSTKAQVLHEVEFSPDVARVFVGGHPVAGRERGGAQAARGDLFAGRPWVLCPGKHGDSVRLDQVRQLVVACGAEPVVMDAVSHDLAMATVSHTPQLLASALAARLVEVTPQALELAGQGLRDTTRIAASDPHLWTQILATNAEPVARDLRRVVTDLTTAAEALEAMASGQQDDSSTERLIDPVTDLLAAGNQGHHRIAGKHGAPAVDYTPVPVVIPDRPGALAELFAAAGKAAVNIEDVVIEHSPGQPVGLVELFVAPASAESLRRALHESGWSVH